MKKGISKLHLHRGWYHASAFKGNK